MGCRMSPEPSRLSDRPSSRSSRVSRVVDEYDPDAKDVISNELQETRNIWKMFEMKKTIGSGASAEVTLVARRTTNTLYALKILNRRHVDYFKSEFELLSRLDCPRIVKFISAYRSPAQYFICMEYCSGDSLLSRLGKRKKYTEGVASNTVKMMLEALRYLNEKNILHRDIKPENFVYSSENNENLKLLDFGIAMEVQPEKLYRFRVGTSYYLAPEVVLNADPRSGELCKKADVWSIGVCIFIMLNGKVPFLGETRKQIFDSILTKEVQFKNTDLSESAIDFVNKLLERDLDKRLTAEEALEHQWIKNFGMSDNDVPFCEELRAFSTRRAVQKALHSVLNVDEVDEKYIKMKFEQVDVNGDGFITKDELKTVLLSVVSEDEVDTMADEFIRDASDNDKIIFEEFRDSMLQHMLSNNDYKIRSIFHALDENKDGYISPQEFVQCIPGAKVHDDDVQDILRAFNDADENDDGVLSYEEFSKILSATESRTKSAFQLLKRQEIDEVINDNERYVTPVHSETEM
jgi:calcium-dependent protein kinase